MTPEEQARIEEDRRLDDLCPKCGSADLYVAEYDLSPEGWPVVMACVRCGWHSDEIAPTPFVPPQEQR